MEQIKAQLYNKTIQVVFDPSKKRGRYQVSGVAERPWSVSEIYGIIDKSTPLMIWANKLMRGHALNMLAVSKKKKFTTAEVIDFMEKVLLLPEQEKVTAGGIGTEVHDWLEGFAKAKMHKETRMPALPRSRAAQQCISGYLDWYNKQKRVKFVSCEEIVYSRRHNYVGTLDTVMVVDGINTLADYKSANKMQPGFLFQIKGYIDARNEEQRYLARVKKNYKPFIIEQGMLMPFDKVDGKFLEPIVFKKKDMAVVGAGFLHCLGLKESMRDARKLFKKLDPEIEI